MAETMLSVADAAKKANVGKNTMYEAVNTRDITYFRPMGKKAVRISESALDAWIAKHTIKTKSA